jgi:hypothetical protein
MALILLDGFDKFGPANSSSAGVLALLTSGEWTTGASAWTIAAPLSATGQALSATFSIANMLSKTLPASYSRLIGGVRFSSSLAGTSGAGVYFSDAGSSQCCIVINGGAGTISMRNGLSTGAILATSSTSVSANSTHYLEWDVTFGNSAAYQVWLDGVSLFSGTGDTTTTANNTANGFGFIGVAASVQVLTVDDLYLFDTSGTTNNAVLLTSPRIETTFPTSDSAVQFGFGAGILGSNISRNTGAAAPTGNTLYLRRFVPSVACTLNSISFLPSGTSGTINYRPVVYADSSGVAGTLMSAGSTVTGATSGTIITMPLTTPQSLSAATSYWLGTMNDSVTINISLLDASVAGARAGVTFSSGAPGTAPAMTTGQPTFLVWGNLTGISGANYYEVNQQPPPGSSSYVFDTTVNHEDLYNFAPLSATPAVIYAVAVKAYTQRSDSGAKTVSMRMKSSTTDSGGSATGQTPATTYGWLTSLFPTDPNTSAAWLAANLNAATSGLKIDS